MSLPDIQNPKSKIQNPNAPFYVAGGTLQRDAACYVPRKADHDLLEGLLAGQFCYVLTSRQMGKSSLMVRTRERLREQGVSVAVLDLTAIGQNLTPEQWYDGLLSRVGRQLDLEDEVEDFWLDNERVGPLERFMRALREVVLEQTKGPIVIFVDEVDAVRSLPFSADEFFAGIRECYNRRTEDPAMKRLTFCLLGVATPSDLIRDTRTTPFNIGKRIELTDFTPEEAKPLADGLNHGAHGGHGEKLLARVLYWTNGHPYLTQRLCQAIAEAVSNPTPNAQRPTPQLVDRLCQELFLSSRARERDDNLLFVRERLLRSDADLASLLHLYGQVRTGKRVKDDETNALTSLLRLSGVTRVIRGYLEVRNRIYFHVFDTGWVLANIPDAEIRRQKAAYRRGLMQSALGWLVLLPLVFLNVLLPTPRNLDSSTILFYIMIGVEFYYLVIWLIVGSMLFPVERGGLKAYFYVGIITVFLTLMLHQTIFQPYFRQTLSFRMNALFFSLPLILLLISSQSVLSTYLCLFHNRKINPNVTMFASANAVSGIISGVTICINCHLWVWTSKNAFEAFNNYGDWVIIPTIFALCSAATGYLFGWMLMLSRRIRREA